MLVKFLKKCSFSEDGLTVIHKGKDEEYLFTNLKLANSLINREYCKSSVEKPEEDPAPAKVSKKSKSQMRSKRW